MQHFSIHKMERGIFDVVQKGFAHKLDDGDCLQIGHDIADFLLGEYRVEEHPPLVHGSPLEAVASGQMSVVEAYAFFTERIDGLAKDLARFAGITGSEVEK